MGFPPPLWCVCTKWSVRVVYTDNGNARRMKEHQALPLNVWYWPSLTALITCWQYKQFRTQLWLDRQDGVNEPYYTDYLTSVQWVMWSYFTLACLKHTSHVSPGMFAFQLQPRITSPQLRPDKARCVIIALWAVCKVMQWHSRWEMFAELRVEELPVFAYRRCV